MSNDLISRKALNDDLINLFKEIDDMYIAGRVIGLLHVQPTAYDPDKIVAQLEQIQNFEERTGRSYCPDSDTECRYKYADLGCTHCAFDKAIEIVKGGAV